MWYDDFGCKDVVECSVDVVDVKSCSNEGGRHSVMLCCLRGSLVLLGCEY